MKLSPDWTTRIDRKRNQSSRFDLRPANLGSDNQLQNPARNLAQNTSRSDSTSRLKAAVQGRDGNALERAMDRLFTFAFKGLVYPQIWEDPAVDFDALALKPCSRMVTIASGGCNVLSYLIAGPKQIVAVDLNRAHVALTRLKLASACHMP